MCKLPVGGSAVASSAEYPRRRRRGGGGSIGPRRPEGSVRAWLILRETARLLTEYNEKYSGNQDGYSEKCSEPDTLESRPMQCELACFSAQLENSE